MGGDERVCAVCYGPMGKIPGDICCREEDQYLLISAKGFLRECEDRNATVDDIVDFLYDRLAEYLLKKGQSIDDYDEDGVMSELERRTLRWINKELIPVQSVSGVAFCAQCGVPILASRTLCSRCGDSKAAQSSAASMQVDVPPIVYKGMHSKR